MHLKQIHECFMRKVIINIIPVLLFLVFGINKVKAESIFIKQDSSAFKSAFWVNLGFNGGYGLDFSRNYRTLSTGGVVDLSILTSEYRYINLNYIDAKDLNFLGSAQSRFYSLSLMTGFLNAQTSLFFNFSYGINVSGGFSRGEVIEGSCINACAYKKDNFFTGGLSLKATAGSTGSTIGFNLGIHLNLNPEITYISLIGTVRIGDIIKDDGPEVIEVD